MLERDSWQMCAHAWGASASAAATSGIRVVNLRTGVVLSAARGALKKQLLPFRLGIGARLGRGDQQFSWISRRDAVDAIAFLMGNSALAGPFNVTSPDPVTNAAFTRALGRALHRPAILAVPEPILRAAVGTENVFGIPVGVPRVLPERLLDSGFTFADRTLSEGLVTPCTIELRLNSIGLSIDPGAVSYR
jgi:uncharacterized protein (TIGR01777 family)